MKILAVDVGTGTQDIFLFDSNLNIENGFKLVLPSPTMMIHNRIRGLRSGGTPLLLTGHQMGGGPAAWAIEEYVRAGNQVYMTPAAASTLNDELDKVTMLGIQIVSEDEAQGLKPRTECLELRDFDFPALQDTFERFGIRLNDLAAISVAVFDHGNAPAGVSDRQFRFDYLDQRIRERNSLAAFAHASHEIPGIMTRLQSVAESAGQLPCPLVVMDTAPAAVLGANFDPRVATRKQKIVCNIGNFHVLAFRLGEGGIEGVFEHHTGEIDLPKLEKYLRALADGSLRHQDIFDDMGHGALVYGEAPFEFGGDDFDVVVTGPRRSMFQNNPTLTPYFAVPFGDMMIAGCFGLLAATAEILPALSDSITSRLQIGHRPGIAPWDVMS